MAGAGQEVRERVEVSATEQLELLGRRLAKLRKAKEELLHPDMEVRRQMAALRRAEEDVEDTFESVGISPVAGEVHADKVKRFFDILRRNHMDGKEPQAISLEANRCFDRCWRAQVATLDAVHAALPLRETVATATVAATDAANPSTSWEENVWFDLGYKRTWHADAYADQVVAAFEKGISLQIRAAFVARLGVLAVEAYEAASRSLDELQGLSAEWKESTKGDKFAVALVEYIEAAIQKA